MWCPMVEAHTAQKWSKIRTLPRAVHTLRYAHCSDTTTLTFCTLYLIQNTTNQVA
jgi:hypothetical protein